MNSFFAVLIFLGIVQGIAEFLPISSSGHLVILEHLPFMEEMLAAPVGVSNLFINVALHVASLIAVIIFLWKDIVSIVGGSVKGIVAGDMERGELKAALYIIIATIPAVVVGVFFRDFIEKLYRMPHTAYVMLIINGFILISTKKIPVKDRKLEEIGLTRSLIIGLFQAFAIIPGISRSGMTIAGGLFNGLQPVDAARFSFLMAVPAIAGAGLLEGTKLIDGTVSSAVFLPLGIAMIITCAVALVSMKILFELVKKIKIDIFGYYTILLGVAGLVIFYLV